MISTGKHIIFCLLAGCCSFIAHAAPVDEQYKKAQALEKTQPDSAASIYRSISEQPSAKPEIRGKAFRKLALLRSGEEKMEEALELCRKAISIFEKIPDKKETGITYNTAANIYQVRGYYDQAIAYYHKAAVLFESIRFYKGLTICYSNIASIYNTTEQPKNALRYNLLAYRTSEISRDTFSSGMIAQDLSIAYTRNQLPDSAAKYAAIALSLGTSINDNFVTGYAWKAFYEYYKANGNQPKAYDAAIQSLSFIQKTNAAYDIAFANCNVAESALNSGNITHAKEAAMKAEQLATGIGSFQLNKRVYGLLKEIASASSDYKAAFEYARKYQQASDSVFFEKRNNTLNDLETKYQTAQKEARIAQQQVLIQQQEIKTRQARIRFIAATVTLLLVLAGAIFLYIFLRQRQRLLRNQILTIEQQKKLELTEAVIEGEEQERARLAKELHDGIGGLMSMVKLQLHSFRDKNSDISDKKEYSEALQLVETAAHDIRSISHALMPSALERLGLAAAVEQLCAQTGRTSGIEVDFQQYGIEERMDAKLELLAYRIIQELLNNILKYARATEVLVQLSKNDDRFHITVEDNGHGFDTSILQKKEGIGLSTMQNRIELLGGKMDIDTAPGKGTAINIDFTAK